MGQGPGEYTVDREHARGGYRYLSLINNGTDEIVLTGLSVYYTAAPTQDLQSSYTGYFHTNDELLNRVWYAGAYTNREYYLQEFPSFERDMKCPRGESVQRMSCSTDVCVLRRAL